MAEQRYEFTFRECFSEFFGMMTIVYFGGWLVILEINDKIYTPELAIASAAIYGVLLWTSLKHSKAQFNPAITLAQMLTKKITQFNALVVIISQLIGCYIGAIIFFYTVPESLNSVAKD